MQICIIIVTSDKADAYSFVPRANLIIQLKLIANGEPVDLYDVFGGPANLKTYLINLRNITQK